MAKKTTTRGRPKGRTDKGEAMRDRLYEISLKSFEKRGFEATTLRDIAAEAGVTAGLLYKYFPSKQAIVLKLYADLSTQYATEASHLPKGNWRTRFLFALKKSIEVLKPHRSALASLTPILVGDEHQGMFSSETKFSRARVEQVFIDAVIHATDTLPAPDAKPLGRVLYVLHLTIVLWWLLDKSPKQRATHSLIATLENSLPMMALSLKFGKARKTVHVIAKLASEGLFGERI